MRFHFVGRKQLWCLLAGTSCLCLFALPADAQIGDRGALSDPDPFPSPPYPGLSVDLSSAASHDLLAGNGQTTSFAPNMLGDFSSVAVFPSSAKIAENESPRPLDRLFFSFNYTNNVDKSILTDTGSALHNVQYFRYTFGVEKTILNGAVSLGVRVPINTIDADGRVASGTGGAAAAPGLTDTDFGDVSVILKGVLAQDRDTGNLISGGLAVTMATGPHHFPSAPAEAILVNGQRGTALQPFVGAIWNADRFFVHGFSAIAIPTNRGDALLLFNDLGVGYYLYRNYERDRRFNAIMPTLELHVNDPLRDRGGANLGGPDIVDLTAGATVVFGRNAALAIGLVTPLTGPKPFDFEVLTHLNVRF